MDKDPSGRSSDDNVDDMGEISFEDINAEPEVIPSKSLDKKDYVDPLMITDEDDERPEKRMKKDITSSIFEKNVKISSSANNTVIQNKIVTSSGSSTLVKIAPRSTVSSLSTATTTMTTNGKIIYLQRSGGSGSVPVRVPTTVGTSASGSNGSKPAVAIQLIRSPHTVIPVKPGKGINIPNVSHLAGKKVITTGGDGSSGQVMIKGPIKKVAGNTTLSSSIGSTIISPVEGAKSNVRQVITSKLPSNTSNGSTSGSGKVLVQNTSGTRQVMVPQSVIKISPNSPRGQLQAIQIPGKPGLQYVRVLGNTSGVTQKVNSQECNTSPNFTVVRQSKPGMKIVVNPATADKERKTMTTVPTLRKINDIVVKTNDGADTKIVRTQKISQINSQIQRFSTPAGGESKGTISGSKYIVVSKSLIQNSGTSQNQSAAGIVGQQRQTIVTSQKDAAKPSSKSPTSSKKLYSVLRPVTDHKEVKLKARVDPIPPKPPAAPTLTASASTTNNPKRPSSRSSPVLSDETAVTIRRKHCNCTKSQCLKLYCDCFANGEFCQDCNCKDCLNNLDNEDERQKAIRICLERNPNSFKPKITAATNESDLRLHNKGCNCKRSGCLKNYCECYEAKIPCSSNCKCIGCRNVEDHPDLDMDVKKGPVTSIQTYSRVKRTYDDMVKPRPQPIQPSTSASAPASVPAVVSNAAAIGNTLGSTADKQSCNFITQEVVDATIQCLIAQADECNKSSLTHYQTEKMIMEELGRCLVEIIDFSIRNTGQN